MAIMKKRFGFLTGNEENLFAYICVFMTSKKDDGWMDR